MKLKVFIQNEAGSDQKNYHDEKTLEWKRSTRVSRSYPYPYGFIIGTVSADGCNVDCFVLTQRQLRTGDIVVCEPLGLMEQVEDGQEDHNVLATLEGESAILSPAMQGELTDFVRHVFDHIEGKKIRVGQYLGHAEAEAHVVAHSEIV